LLRHRELTDDRPDRRRYVQHRPSRPRRIRFGARDGEELKRVGRCNTKSTGHRTPEQTLIAPSFRAGEPPGSGVVGGVLPQWERAFDLWQRVHPFALTNMAQHDANVAMFDTRYAHCVRRPVIAIDAGNAGGSAATEADRAWLSCLGTPPKPDVTCDLATGGRAANDVCGLLDENL